MACFLGFLYCFGLCLCVCLIDNFLSKSNLFNCFLFFFICRKGDQRRGGAVLSRANSLLCLETCAQSPSPSSFSGEGLAVQE